jgi:hypothetical protein
MYFVRAKYILIIHICDLEITNIQIIIRNHVISELFVIIFVFDVEYKDNRFCSSKITFKKKE